MVPQNPRQDSVVPVEFFRQAQHSEHYQLIVHVWILLMKMSITRNCTACLEDGKFAFPFFRASCKFALCIEDGKKPVSANGLSCGYSICFVKSM
ncbi:unnamed protein product [Amaranthus hypochondriacus]